MTTWSNEVFPGDICVVKFKNCTRVMEWFVVSSKRGDFEGVDGVTFDVTVFDPIRGLVETSVFIDYDLVSVVARCER